LQVKRTNVRPNPEDGAVKEVLRILGVAAIAFLVAMSFSVGFGIGDGFRADLVSPSVFGLLPAGLLFTAGYLAGFARKGWLLAGNLAAIYLSLVAGRLLVTYGTGMETTRTMISNAVTLGFTVRTAVISGLDPPPDAIPVRLLGVAAQVGLVVIGVGVARLVARRNDASIPLA
jgi:hypothetical protein